MNTQHTPGPWTFSTNEQADAPADSYLIRARFPEGFDATVAHVRMQSGTTAGEYANANARLIAMSPGLLGVARELVRLWDAGLRPQVIKGMHREETDFAQLVLDARNLLKTL